MKSLLLAAGLAKRFQPHSLLKAKASFPFLNLPILYYSLYHLQALSSEIHFNTHSQPLSVKKAIAFSNKDFSFKEHHEKKLLGAAGTLFNLKKHFESDEHFFYANADSLYFSLKEELLSELLARHKESGNLMTFLVRPVSKNEKASFLWHKQGRLISVGLRSGDIQAEPSLFVGLACVSRELLSFSKPSDFDLFQDLLNPILSTQKAGVFLDNSLISFELGDLDSYLSAHRLCLNHLLKNTNYKKSIGRVLSFYKKDWNKHEFERGFSETELSQNFLNKLKKQDSFFIGNSVQGLENLSLSGFNVLGDQVQIQKALSLKNTVVEQKHALVNSYQENLILKTKS